jgi:hypothetical protein
VTVLIAIGDSMRQRRHHFPGVYDFVGSRESTVTDMAVDPDMLIRCDTQPNVRIYRFQPACTHLVTVTHRDAVAVQHEIASVVELRRIDHYTPSLPTRFGSGAI